MKSVFEQGEFSAFSKARLDEARSAIPDRYEFGQTKTTVFISHKHDELDDLKGILGFLEQSYDVKVYIDSQDSSMPKVTSSETAQQIKQRIKRCDKFILLATNGAIDSKWCNWELGFGDANKYKDNIALFPMKPVGTYDINYRGNEYMSIYPYISYSGVSETYSNGSPIPKGYYIYTKDKDSNYITPLAEWLRKR